MPVKITPPWSFITPQNSSPSSPMNVASIRSGTRPSMLNDPPLIQSMSSCFIPPMSQSCSKSPVPKLELQSPRMSGTFPLSLPGPSRSPHEPDESSPLHATQRAERARTARMFTSRGSRSLPDTGPSALPAAGSAAGRLGSHDDREVVPRRLTRLDRRPFRGDGHPVAVDPRRKQRVSDLRRLETAELPIGAEALHEGRRERRTVEMRDDRDVRVGIRAQRRREQISHERRAVGESDIL